MQVVHPHLKLSGSASDNLHSHMQITALLSKLPLLSMKWRVETKSHRTEYSAYVMPLSVKERKWTGINASSEEECIVQLELCRGSLSPTKVYRIVSPLKTSTGYFLFKVQYFTCAKLLLHPPSNQHEKKKCQGRLQ